VGPGDSRRCPRGRHGAEGGEGEAVSPTVRCMHLGHGGGRQPSGPHLCRGPGAAVEDVAADVKGQQLGLLGAGRGALKKQRSRGAAQNATGRQRQRLQA
jgi:hypothetical protein